MESAWLLADASIADRSGYSWGSAGKASLLAVFPSAASQGRSGPCGLGDNGSSASDEADRASCFFEFRADRRAKNRSVYFMAEILCGFFGVNVLVVRAAACLSVLRGWAPHPA